MLEITHATMVPHLGLSIIGRTDHELKDRVRHAKKMLGKPRKSTRTYLVDHELVNAVFSENKTHQEYVCRSVVKQWNWTGWVLTGLLIQRSGSSKAVTLHSFNRSALMETEHADGFWFSHTLVSGNNEKKCVYCGAGVKDQTHYTCGMARDYAMEHNKYSEQSNQLHSSGTVHDSILPHSTGKQNEQGEEVEHVE